MALNNNNNDISCKCTTPEYEIILNEQGPQGRQGEKGDAGFTPIISVKDNTPSNYTLNILTQDGQITTPNLKANLPAGGATGQVLTKNSGEQDDCSWQNLPASTIETEGIARLATEADFETTEDTEASDNTIVTPALFNSELSKQSANFVTTNTDQDITGYKTFKRQTQFHNTVIVRPEGGSTTSSARVELGTDFVSYQPFIRLYNSNNWSSRIGLYNDTIMYIQAPFESDRIVINNFDSEDAPTGNAKDVVIYGNLINKNNNIASRVLNQDNVTAGNNITIDKTSTGITINSTGGTSDYTQLTNKPQINGIELTGNKNGNDLGLANESEIEELGNELNQLANDVTNLDTNKQDKLTAGDNITIEGNVISATGGGGLEVKTATTANFSSSELLETGLYYISAGLNPQNGPVGYSVAAMLITMKWFAESSNQRIQQTWIGCEDLVANQIYTRYSSSNGTMGSWTRVDSNKIASASALGSIKVGDGLTISSDGTLSASDGSAPTNMVTTDTAQTITGKKNFTNTISLNSVIKFNTSTALIKGEKSNLDIILGAYDDRIMIGSQNTRTIKLNSNAITDYNGNNLLSSANVEAGNNVTIEKTSTGIKISSTGGGGGTGDVTLTGDNSFTGNNTFDGISTFNGDTWVDFLKVGTSLKNQQDKLFLNQSSITAGSDNLVITETETGIQLTVNVPTNAQIGQILESLADLNTKINTLTNRVITLETQIDGGIA
nr:MAG TPA: hypothetical protein [Caudoviricetes sp.]